jgi:hypothetical protein
MATNPFANQPGFPKDFLLVDANGVMTVSWQYFFLNVWQRLQTIYATFFFSGMPTASQVQVYINTVPAQIPPNFITVPPQVAPNIPGLFVFADTNPSTSVTFTLYQVSYQLGIEMVIGTIVVNPDGSFVGSTAGASLAVGDLLVLTAPAAPDPLLNDIEFIIPMLWA